ncbi:phage portal protein [Streptosporangium sp. NBC_01755]|uniref:phage portal protein n=1 Tax=Streptosporangium sp. NBC_01755 TaxID=2975949 RepID=UPI002DD8025A|nr:phage portal protein [Streptosporangium sp. NBC_01755]WSD03251.1 phage portal protein [Streptosporangium sp. NBC_01755]
MTSMFGALASAFRNQAPVPYVGRSASWALPFLQRNDAESQMRAMGSVGTLFSIVHRTSNAASQVNWSLWRQAASGRKEDRTEVTRHLALDIWTRPNPFFTRQEFVESVQQHVDLTGEGWWVIARNPMMRSIPLEIWPVRPDRISPVPDPEEFIRGYVYRGPDGEQIPLERDEVIQLRMPNPLDPYRGMGPVQSILTDLDSTRYSAEWNRNFFLNSAEPGGIIEVDKRLSDDEFDELRDRWNEQHRGIANAHRVALLEQGRWVDRKFTQRDMQFVELRGVARDVIREAYGMPKFAVGDVDDVNRATAEASKAWFAEQLTVPRLERFKQALNNDFLPLFGATAAGLEFDYVDPVPANREADNDERLSKAESAHRLVSAGWEPAAVLSAVGLPEMPYVGPPAGVPKPRIANSRRRPLVLRAQAEPEETREDWQEPLEELLADWADVSEGQREELARQIESLVDEGRTEDLAALTASSDVGAALLEATLFAQAEAVGERMVEAAEEQGVTITAAAVAGVLAATLAAGAAVTAGLLATGLAVAAGREALRVWAPDMSGEQVAERVVEHLEALSDASLRTELGGAIWAAEGAGRFATLEQAEADGKGATWYEASEIRDDATCEFCEKADGRRYDTLPEAQAQYPNGGYWACKGGIRCRGTVEPRWDES